MAKCKETFFRSAVKLNVDDNVVQSDYDYSTND